MPQVSLYIEQKVLDTARQNAKAQQISLSKYVSQILEKGAKPSWPPGYWDLFGALDDDSFTRPDDQPFDQVSDPVEFA